ncbi:MAG: 3'-5' exoribonuclease YhaM family protein [Methylocystaceae bacterium]
MSRKMIVALGEGEKIEIPLLVKEKMLLDHKNRAGKYMHLVLGDNSGEINAYVWDNTEEMAKRCTVGKVSVFKGDVISYRDSLQIRVIAIRLPLTDEVVMEEFVPVASRPLKEMETELLALVESMKTGIWKEIAENFILSEHYPVFCQGTAAKAFHHNYMGGLLEHTLGVMKVVDHLAQVYEETDRELMIMGALLHDIGKVKEMEFTPGICYTDAGRLLGHIVLGLQMTEELLAGLDSISDQQKNMVLHIIASHHGEYEWQSPKRPQFVEAKLVHLADMLDAEVFKYASARPDEPGSKWSLPIKGLGDPVFVGARSALIKPETD